MQTPALNSHQINTFPLPGAHPGTAQSSFSACSAHFEQPQVTYLSRSCGFRKFWPHLNFCSKMTARSKKLLVQKVAEKPPQKTVCRVSHSSQAGSYPVGRRCKRLSASSRMAPPLIWHRSSPICHQLPICGGHMLGTHRAEHGATEHVAHTQAARKPRRISLLILCGGHTELASSVGTQRSTTGPGSPRPRTAAPWALKALP